MIPAARRVRRAGLWVILATVACAPAVDSSWHEEQGFRWRLLDVDPGETVGFSPLRASSTGIDHANVVDDEHAMANRHLLIGAGVAIGDVDGDGLPEIFLASVESPAALYHNEGGMRFREVTATSGLTLAGRATTGAAFADVDGDRDLDLLVGTLGGPVCLFVNNGAGSFTDATATSGLDSGYAATTLALADVEGDGDLDLYVATYKVRNALDAYPPQARAFDQVVKKIGDRYRVVPEWEKEYRIEDRPDLGGIVRYQRAERDLFYLNDGTGKFAAQPMVGPRWRDEDGAPLTDAPDYFSLAARFHDVNGDGAPDLYVCNDFEDPDQFWLNDGAGNFRLVPRLAVRATSNTCMSVDFADINRDGHVDFFTADMLSPTREARQRQIPTHTPLPKSIGESPDRAQWMRNTLQLARGDGTWAQIADFAGVAATDWTWGSAFLDVDLDGYDDLLVAAGHRWDVRDADTFDRIRNAFPRVPWNREQGEFPRLAVPSVALHNERNLTFQPRGAEWRFGTDSAIAHGIALGDLDGDGDLDPVVTHLNEPPVVYRNEARRARVAVRLSGQAPNTGGIGARVTVRAATLPPQSQEISGGGAYLSSNEPLLVFATASDSLAEVTVRWRSGRVSRGHVRANTLVEFDERGAGEVPAVTDTGPPPLFADVTPLLGGHRHTEPPFDDFRRQALLPERLSQSGPGVAWADVDGDGREDLFVGAGRGGRPAILRNTPGGFVRREAPVVAGDLGGVVPTYTTRSVSFLAAQSSWEDSVLVASVIGIGTDGAPRTVVGADSASPGVLASADADGDGIPDLFVGTRVRPGAWPLPARSHLYRGTRDGTYALDAGAESALGALGLVTAATFADLTGDGWPELVIASEWGPVRVLHNERGRFTDVTRQLGLSGITSRWRGITAGDFDGDGRLDLVVTSWGRNVPWRASEARPHVLLVGRDASQVSLVFARTDSITGAEMPTESLSRLGVALPVVRQRIPSFAAYARASVDSVIGPSVANMIRVGATTYDHLLLLNRGDRFDVRSLPDIAQLAPASAAVVADFDGDGREDLYLGQNFFPTEISMLRFDAGVGLILLGDGAGGFSPLTTLRAGISVPGDQRGAATADFDLDGRPDLVVAQNGAATRLFRNASGRPGLRVRLDGGSANPAGIGAQLRVSAGDRQGPVREIRAGTGYWSTDGAATVLALPEGATELRIRWPGGTQQRVPVAPGQREVRVSR